MLVNVSYNNKEIIQSITSEVGKPYRWKERWKMGGIGSPKLFISDASKEIMELLELDNKINSSNIEIRPRGIILRFRSILETFAVVIPYHKLAIFKSGDYTIHGDGHFIKIASGEKAVQKFCKKVLDLKIKASHGSIQEM